MRHCTFNSNAFLYADDTTFLVSGDNHNDIEKRLQTAANHVTEYKKWQLKVNVQKCQAVFYQLGPQIPALNINIEGKSIPSSSSFRYLGVILDHSLTFKEQCVFIQLKLRKWVNILKMLSGTGWGASVTTLPTTTTSLIQSVDDYCSTSWGPSSHSHLIDKVMLKLMRIISGLPKPTKLEFLPQVSKNLQVPE